MRSDPWTTAALVAVAGFGCVYGFREIFSPDLGFYLATGREIAATGGIPRTDTLTWTRPDAPYVNLWWLYQLVNHGAWQLGGTLAIRLGHIAFTLACLGLAIRRAYERDGRMPLAGPALLLLFALASLWEARPHVASWLLLSCVLLVLARDGRRTTTPAKSEGRELWWLPAILLVWINTHALFVLGFVVLGLHGLDRLLEPGRRRDLRLYVVGAASLLLCLANPFFLDALLLPLEQLRILEGSAFTSPDQGIAEYRPLFHLSPLWSGERLELFHPHVFALVYALVACIGLALAWPRVRWSELLLFLAFGYLFVGAIRNFGFFFLVSFPVVAAGWDRLLERAPQGLRRGVPVSVLCVALILIPLTLHGRLFAWEWSPHRLGTRFNADVLPVELCRFMLEHDIDGRILNSWNDGGYIAFATGRKTFIDGRMEVMGDDLYAEYLRLKDPAQISAALARVRPEVAIVPHTRLPLWLHTFARRLRWRMVYADESWALFLPPGRGRALPEVAWARPVAGRDYPALTREEIRGLLDAERDVRGPGWRELWAGRDAFPLRAVRLSGFFFQTGAFAAAAAVGLEALRESAVPVPDLYLNVGYALLEVGDRANADRAFGLFVEHSRVPADVSRVQRLRAGLRRGSR